MNISVSSIFTAAGAADHLLRTSVVDADLKNKVLKALFGKSFEWFDNTMSPNFAHLLGKYDYMERAEKLCLKLERPENINFLSSPAHPISRAVVSVSYEPKDFADQPGDDPVAFIVRKGDDLDVVPGPELVDDLANDDVLETIVARLDVDYIADSVSGFPVAIYHNFSPPRYRGSILNKEADSKSDFAGFEKLKVEGNPDQDFFFHNVQGESDTISDLVSKLLNKKTTPESIDPALRKQVMDAFFKIDDEVVGCFSYLEDKQYQPYIDSDKLLEFFNEKWDKVKNRNLLSRLFASLGENQSDELIETVLRRTPRACALIRNSKWIESNLDVFIAGLKDWRRVPVNLHNTVLKQVSADTAMGIAARAFKAIFPEILLANDSGELSKEEYEDMISWNTESIKWIKHPEIQSLALFS
jgi:hypothetical protein